MTKDVTVAELEESLSEKLGEVREGTTFRVIADGKTIARIEPNTYPDVTTFPYPKPRGMYTPSNDQFGPPRLKWDPVEILLVDRGRMREFATFPDPALGPLGEWTPPSLHLDWDPVEDLVAERDRHR